MNKKPLIILFISVSIAIIFFYVNNKDPELIKSSNFSKLNSLLNKIYNNENKKVNNEKNNNKNKFNDLKDEISEKKVNKKEKIKDNKNENNVNEKKINIENKKYEQKEENRESQQKKIKENLKIKTKNYDVKREIIDEKKDTKENIKSVKDNIKDESKTRMLFENEEEEYDIIVVGAGLAGVTATYESYIKSKGKLKIVLLEKQKNFGGNSAKATSGINILNSPLQKAENIQDTYDLFFSDTIKSGKGRSVPDLVSSLVKDSVSVFDFFTNIKADLSKLGLLGGHSVPRTCRPTNATVGYHLTSTVYKTLINSTTIIFSPNSTVIELIYDDKKRTVNGVKVLINGKEKILKSKTVILTCGGFGHDFDSKDSLLKEYVPNIMKFPTTNGPQTRGDGMKIARSIGADLVDMDQVQIHPTGYVDFKDRFSKNKILAPELLRGVGGILINQKGERFCNELGTRDYVTEQILKNCEKIPNELNIDQYESYLILNENSTEKFGKNIKFYIGKGLIKKYNNFEDFANSNKIDFKNLAKTIATYNDYATKKQPDPFGKTIYPEQFKINQPVYVAVISPVIHYCMGGIKINKNTEVISTKRKKKKNLVIKGLFAAGEVTGGVHGGNRLGGNSLLECAVFGRRAAKSAIKYIEKLKKNK